jgi:hypothetical protein
MHNNRKTTLILGWFEVLLHLSLSAFCSVGFVGWWKRGHRVRALLCLLLSGWHGAWVGRSMAVLIEEMIEPDWSFADDRDESCQFVYHDGVKCTTPYELHGHLGQHPWQSEVQDDEYPASMKSETRADGRTYSTRWCDCVVSYVHPADGLGALQDLRLERKCENFWHATDEAAYAEAYEAAIGWRQKSSLTD